jgi:hypothetical protein
MDRIDPWHHDVQGREGWLILPSGRSGYARNVKIIWVCGIDARTCHEKGTAWVLSR